MNIIQYPTKNFGYPAGTHGRGGHDVVGLVNHIMQASIAQYLAWISGPVNDSENSATFSVARDGRVFQHVALSDAHWCNGPMKAPDTSVPFIADCWRNHVNPNLVTVSIEHEGDTGQPFTEAQTQATIELHKYILAHCPGILPDRKHIVGHYQIDSVNKSRCPGPAFPWTRLLGALGQGESMTDAEKASIGQIAQVIYDQNRVIGQRLDELDALLGVTPLTTGIRDAAGKVYDQGVTRLKVLAGLQPK